MPAMSRFVRASKFRHVYGTPTKREACYENIKVSNTAWDCDLISVNPQFFAVQWNAGGGGAFAVIPIEKIGRLPENYPTFCGHTGPVLDTSWNPFNDHVIASGAEDAKLMIWKFDSLPLEEPCSSPVLTLAGHQRKVGHVIFHPTAENVLLSASGDLTLKVWDVNSGSEAFSISEFTEIPQSLCWNRNGSRIASTCRDHKIRIFDPRGQSVVQDTTGHQGVKGSRVVWLGGEEMIATTGFSKLSDRQLNVWDLRKFGEPLHSHNLDTSSGVLMPFYDPDTKMLYLAGKGDGNIRYYEFENGNFEFLNEYKSSEPQRGIGFIPKRACHVNENEVTRAFKVHMTFIEPIPFRAPRRAETFQADIFPETQGDEPSISAQEWTQGKDGEPKLISLEKGFVPQAQREFTTSAPAPNSPKRDANGLNANVNRPQTENYEQKFHELKRDYEALQNELESRNLRIHQLENQLAAMSSK